MVKKSVVVEGEYTKFTWTFNGDDMSQKYLESCAGVDQRVTSRMKSEEMCEWKNHGFCTFQCYQMSVNKETPSNRLKMIASLDNSILDVIATAGDIKETLTFGNSDCKQEISWMLSVGAIKFTKLDLCDGLSGIYGVSVNVKHNRGQVERVMLTYHGCESHAADNHRVTKPDSDQTTTALTVTAFDRGGCCGETPRQNTGVVDLFTLTIKLFNTNANKEKESERNLNMELWENRNNTSDVKFTFKDGSSVNAHKLILSAASDVFKNMFDSNMREGQSGKVEIHDDKRTFEKLLEFLYLVPAIKVKFDEDTDIVVLMELAHRYNLQHIKMKCVKHLLMKDENGAAEVLEDLTIFSYIQRTERSI